MDLADPVPSLIVDTMYEQLAISDDGMLIAARAGHSLDQLLGSPAEGLASLGLGPSDVHGGGIHSKIPVPSVPREHRAH